MDRRSFLGVTGLFLMAPAIPMPAAAPPEVDPELVMRLLSESFLEDYRRAFMELARQGTCRLEIRDATAHT